MGTRALALVPTVAESPYATFPSLSAEERLALGRLGREGFRRFARAGADSIRDPGTGGWT